MSDSATSTSLFGKIRFLLGLLTKHRQWIVRILVLEIIIALSNALIPYFTKLQIDQLQRQSIDFFKQFDSFSLFVLLLIIPAVIELLRLFIFDRFNQKLSAKLEAELLVSTEATIWCKLEKLDAGFFDNTRNQRILDSVLDAARITQNFIRFVKNNLASVISILAIVPLLGLINWQLLVIVSLATGLQAILTQISRIHEVSLSAIEDLLQDNLWRFRGALRIHFLNLRSIGAIGWFLEQYKKFTRELNGLKLRRDLTRSRLFAYQAIIQNGLALTANLYVGWQVWEGNLTIGTFTIVVSYTLQLSGIFRNLLESNQDWQEIDLQLDRLSFFFLLQPRLLKVAHPIEEASSPKEIVLDDVHFAYPDLTKEERDYLNFVIRKIQGFLSKFTNLRYKYELDELQKLLETKQPKQEVLKGASLKITRGKITALLGRNGAGKTTVTRLMMHYYEPNNGSIMIDGQPVYKYDSDLLAKQFALIDQSSFILYRFSIKDNLLLGVDPKPSDEKIWQWLEKIDLKSVVERLPKQLDTIIGEDQSLSGGQYQLLAVTRVLLQNKPFVIFDEGVSQLDIEHEAKIMNLLKDRAKKSGILFITHRITTARKADYIYILDKGVIAEEGTHQQLVNKANGLYSKFWKMQVVE